MKLTNKQLRQIIKEELDTILNEKDEFDQSVLDLYARKIKNDFFHSTEALEYIKKTLEEKKRLGENDFLKIRKIHKTIGQLYPKKMLEVLKKDPNILKNVRAGKKLQGLTSNPKEFFRFLNLTQKDFQKYADSSKGGIEGSELDEMLKINSLIRKVGVLYQQTAGNIRSSSSTFDYERGAERRSQKTLPGNERKKV